MSDELLLWCDLETEGLYPHPPKHQRIFEIGMMITDLDLEVIAKQSYPIFYDGFVPTDCDPFIFKMHTQNGLFSDMAAKGIDLRDAEEELIDWLDFYKVPLDRTTPVCGNSIRMDREFLSVHMPLLDSKLSYRIIDVSSFKETFRRYRPEEYEDFRARYTEDDKHHRVLDDIQWSIDEYRYYLQKMRMIPEVML